MKITIFVMVLLLTACSGAAEPPASPEISTPANEEVTAPETENEQASEGTRPQNETFDLMTGEGNQSHTATLHQGEGFSLYVFEKFEFDAAQGRLFLSSNPEYYVDIEPLPANYDLTQLKSAGKKELEEFGKVSDFSESSSSIRWVQPNSTFRPRVMKGLTIILCGNLKQATLSCSVFIIQKAKKLRILPDRSSFRYLRFKAIHKERGFLQVCQLY